MLKRFEDAEAKNQNKDLKQNFVILKQKEECKKALKQVMASGKTVGLAIVSEDTQFLGLSFCNEKDKIYINNIFDDVTNLC